MSLGVKLHPDESRCLIFDLKLHSSIIFLPQISNFKNNHCLITLFVPSVLRKVDTFFQIYYTRSNKCMKNNQEFITLNG